MALYSDVPFYVILLSINYIAPKAFFYASSATRKIVRMPYPIQW